MRLHSSCAAAFLLCAFATSARAAPFGAPSGPPAAQSGPWLELQAGPSFQHASGSRGLGSGPLLRMSLGMELGDIFVAELWAAGNISSAPLSTPGDRAQVGGGAGARLLLHRFDPEGKLALWAHAGAGLLSAAAPDTPQGLAGFAGPSLVFQPLLRRFALGMEIDAVASRGSLGFALLPSLRCAL